MEALKILYNILFIIMIPAMQRADNVTVEYAVVVGRICSGERGNLGVLDTMPPKKINKRS